MDEVTMLETLVSSAPSAVAVIIVVILFLNFLRRSETVWSESLRRTCEECRRMETRTIEALDRNSVGFGRVESTMDRLEKTLDRNGH